ncbi:DUF2884 family protein [Microbulbifer pacificus]|uniref:DUF2884 family protein n=1 Tax=Microbulbifer pacificus TaxID=407164 RepID=A0AAU0MW43_9GAMM|nr:DUF2884 family protein [Microbulbifer pacificus]WOX04352.1 DUF2884 family protein [Microbulbifer pacificus]
MNKIRLLTAASILALPFAAQVQATEINLAGGDEHSCNVDIHQQITVGRDFMETRDEDDNQPLFAYHAPDQLAVGDTGLILDRRQQELMQSYQQGLHTAGRQVSEIAVEAMDIAMNGVGIALAVLAGPDSADTQEFLQSSEALREKLLAQTKKQGDVYTFGSPWVDDVFGETFERELEPQIEKLAAKSAGNIAWHAMKAVFTGGASIERDAEAAAEAAEAEVEKKAERLEARADALCLQLQALDELEVKLHQAIPALQGMELITMK